MNPCNTMNTNTTKQHVPGKVFHPFTGLLAHVLDNLEQFPGNGPVATGAPRVNIVEHKEGYTLELLVPGYAKEDLKMQVEKDVLTVSGEAGQEQQVTQGRHIRKEFARAAFERSFRIPAVVDVEQIAAKEANGILVVTMPKKEMAAPQVKAINIA